MAAIEAKVIQDADGPAILKEKPGLVPATLVPDEVLNPDKYKEVKK